MLRPKFNISHIKCRAVGRSENPGVPVSFGGDNLPPLVDIGLTDLPKSGGAMATPGTTGLELGYLEERGCKSRRNIKNFQNHTSSLIELKNIFALDEGH